MKNFFHLSNTCAAAMIGILLATLFCGCGELPATDAPAVAPGSTTFWEGRLEADKFPLHFHLKMPTDGKQPKMSVTASRPG